MEKIVDVLNYLKNFNEEIGIKDKDSFVIGVSGGVDSMVLLFLMKKLNYNLSAVHINHNTRKIENKKEENLVIDFCQKEGIKLDIFDYKPRKGNFEKNARDFRYGIFKSYNKKILTAHHIDDSFEWHLMQKFKSGSDNNLGIPVRNGNIFRPLMSLTKKQIYYIAKKYSIPYLEDSSNNSLDYERNYVRNMIVPSIAKKYPNYLKNYVNQMNNLAKERRIHISSISITENKKEKELPIMSNYKDIENLIRFNSNKPRGKISNNLNAMLKAINSGKRNFTMNFSGNVNLRVEKDLIKIVDKS